MSDENLEQLISETYLNYCKSYPKKTSIVTCHTNLFKEVDPFVVRFFGYLYLKCKYGIHTYHQNHKIPTSFIEEYNKAITQALQNSNESNRVEKAIISVLASHDDLYKSIADEYKKEQEKNAIDYNTNRSKYLKELEEKNETFLPELIFCLLICIGITIYQICFK